MLLAMALRTYEIISRLIMSIRILDRRITRCISRWLGLCNGFRIHAFWALGDVERSR
jgi:hypothetical protein